MKVLLFGVTLALIGAIGFTSPTMAHVLIADDSKTSAGVIHIMPDDDPVAGTRTTVYFDTQGGLITDESRVSLRVTADGRASENVDVTVNESVVTALVSFPTRGVYELAYTIINDGEQTLFTHTLRVTRGDGGVGEMTQRQPWAEGLLVAAGLVMIALLVVGINRRRAIAASTK